MRKKKDDEFRIFQQYVTQLLLTLRYVLSIFARQYQFYLHAWFGVL